MILNIVACPGLTLRMTRSFFITAGVVLALALTAPPSVAQASCTATYKAKRQGAAGLQLDYGTMQLSGAACTSTAAARAAVNARLAQNGWQLLRLVSVK